MSSFTCQVCGEEIDDFRLFRTCARCHRVICPAHANVSALPPHFLTPAPRQKIDTHSRPYYYCEDCFMLVEEEHEEKWAEEDEHRKEMEEFLKNIQTNPDED